MAATATRTNTNGVVNRMQLVLSGTYTASSEALAESDGITLGSGVLTIKPGFEPLAVTVINVTDRLTQKWFKGMNQGDFLEIAANGDQTLETDDKVVVAVSESGSAPVVTKPTYTVTVLANGGAITDNDTVVVVIEG